VNGGSFLGIEIKEELLRAAEIALMKCLRVRAGESVLVVTDEPTRIIGLHLWLKARELGAEAIYMEMIPRSVHGEEPPKPVAEAMKVANVVVAPTSRSLTHTVARKEAAERGARVATMPGITEDIFVRTMGVDYDLVQRLTNLVADVLDEGREVKVTTSLGTDLVFSIEGRKARRSTGILINPGDWGNLPSGEAYIAPVEGTANGVVVVDGSMAGVGLLTQPIRITFRDGVAEHIEGGPEAAKLRELLSRYGVEARNLGEFGVGTNPGARVSGIVLEDEKVLGTVHIALGSNFDFGGRVRAPVHLDGVIMKPNVYVDGCLVMREGVLLIGSGS
jgi:leucyl aminopeptidase (aminopeptidase T)